MVKFSCNSILSLFFVISTYFISYSQTDSLKFGVKFWDISDSLLEVNDYEGALWHLKIGYSYQVGDNHYKEFYNKFKKKEKHLDSLITCCLTDSMKCNTRLKNGIKSFEEEDYSQVDRWFREARMYCNNSEFYRENLNKIIHLMPTDTVKLNYMNHGALQLMRMTGINANMETSSPNLSSIETIYFRKDSTLYNGVVTWKQFIGDPEQGRVFKIWNIENGKIVKYEKHTVCKNKSASAVTTYDSIKKTILNEFDGDFYYCGIEKNMGNLKIHLSRTGDTLFKTVINGEEKEMIQYLPNGDTLSIETTSRADTNKILVEKKKWNTNKKLIIKSIHTYTNDYTPIRSETIEYDENGDTLMYTQYLESSRVGVQIDPIHSINGDYYYPLKSFYKKDSLVDIINSDIIFFDERYRQIDGTKFLELLIKKQDGNPLEPFEYIYTWARTFVIDGKEYNAVGYPKNKWNNKNIQHLKKKISELEEGK